jgi:hypothetical protein
MVEGGGDGEGGAGEEEDEVRDYSQRYGDA